MTSLLRRIGIGREWAGARTIAEFWQQCQRPDWMLWLLEHTGYHDEQVLREFGCWCVRQVWGLLDDPLSREAVEVAERYARGEATAEELTSARSAALDAATAAAWDTTHAAAFDAAYHAANDAACADRKLVVAEAAQANHLREIVSWEVVENLAAASATA